MPKQRKKRAPRVAIVAADFNATIVEAMIAAAASEVGAQGASLVGDPLRVHGSYETPLVASRLLGRRDVDAIVVLGYIERGDTQHGEVMGHVVHAALVNLSIEHEKPVGLGLIGPGATLEQAELRKDSYARAAVRAALRARHALALAR
jgi:6,7-dimethyl-8-ribityllumazine synthase